VILDEDRWRSLIRMAQHCAETWRGGTPLAVLTYADRRELALGGMLDHLAARGWDDDKALFRAGANAIGRAADEAGKHAGRDWWWGDPDNPDWLAEEVTDRVAAWQIAWGLTDAEWAAVWALLEVQPSGGGWRDAARLLGIEPKALSKRLSNARARGRQLWVPPDETAGRLFRGKHGGRHSKAAKARYRREAKSRELWKETG